MRYNERIQKARKSLRKEDYVKKKSTRLKPDYWDNLKKVVIKESEAEGGKQ